MRDLTMGEIDQVSGGGLTIGSQSLNLLAVVPGLAVVTANSVPNCSGPNTIVATLCTSIGANGFLVVSNKGTTGALVL
jgi:hypothetical protein